MASPKWFGPSLTVPDSGQGICHGVGRYVIWISPHVVRSSVATPATQVRILDSRSVRQSISREKLAYEVAKTVLMFAQPQVRPPSFKTTPSFLSGGLRVLYRTEKGQAPKAPQIATECGP